MKCTVFSAMLRGPRAKQEDCIIDGLDLFQSDRLKEKKKFDTDFLLLLACDGMGGHDHGDMASRFVCEQFKKKMINGAFCAENIESILSEIQNLALEKLPENCGTTVAGLIITDDHAIAFNAGDSRVYRISENEINYISHDHSLVQGLVDKSFIRQDNAPLHPLKNLIDFGIGPIFNDAWENNHIHIHDELISKDTWYLLCTDGLNDLLPDQEIHDRLWPSPVKNGANLLKKIKKKGLKDNISFIIVRIHHS